jgi:hypothetical protein
MAIKRCGRIVKSFLNSPCLQIDTRRSLPFSVGCPDPPSNAPDPYFLFGYGRTSLNTSSATYASSAARRGAPHNALLTFLRSVFALAARKRASSYGFHQITPPARTGETQASPSTRSAHTNSISSSRRRSTTRRRWRTRGRKKWICFYY